MRLLPNKMVDVDAQLLGIYLLPIAIHFFWLYIKLYLKLYIVNVLRYKFDFSIKTHTSQ